MSSLRMNSHIQRTIADFEECLGQESDALKALVSVKKSLSYPFLSPR